MKLSIIICTLNVEKKLEKTLNSIWSQNVDDYEVVIVDGVSKDGTIDIIKKYEKKFGNKLRWISEEDTGIYNAMNKGVKMAEGEYLNIIGAGDWLEKDALKNVYKQINKNVDIDAVQGKLKVWDKNLKNDYLLQTSPKTLWKDPMQHPALVYKKELHNKYGLYDENYKIASDYLFCMKAFLIGEAKVSLFNCVIDNYVTDGISSRNFLQCEEENMRARKELGLLPLVSIIMPTYNQEQYIIDALNSVIKQKYLNWECIIIDDGSTDNTSNVVKKFIKKDNRFKYVKQKNLGPAAARNNGVLQSKGEFILPLDSDDIISKEYVHDAIAVFMERPKTKLVYCEAEFFGEISGKWGLEKYSYNKILFENMIFCSAMYRRSDYNKTKGYNSNMREGLEDWDFWLTFLQKEDIVYKIPRIHFFYRIKEGSRNNMNDNLRRKLYKQLFLNHRDKYEEIMSNPIYYYDYITNKLKDTLYNKKEQNQHQAQMLKKMQKEIDFMKSSKFWKLRDKYLRIKSFINF